MHLIYVDVLDVLCPVHNIDWLKRVLCSMCEILLREKKMVENRRTNCIEEELEEKMSPMNDENESLKNNDYSNFSKSNYLGGFCCYSTQTIYGAKIKSTLTAFIA